MDRACRTFEDHKKCYEIYSDTRKAIPPVRGIGNRGSSVSIVSEYRLYDLGSTLGRSK
jgi:hypothetical protein